MKRDIGPKARAWKGMKAGYVAKHTWIVKHYGKAKICEQCGTKDAKRYEWSNLSGKYLREISDYIQLCPSCHRRKDYGNFCKKGHAFTPENTKLSKQGWRLCKKCYQLRRKKNHEARN